MSTAELASSYAALILADDGVEITVREIPTSVASLQRGPTKPLTLNTLLQSDKLQALIKAAGVEIEPIWTSLFAKV